MDAASRIPKQVMDQAALAEEMLGRINDNPDPNAASTEIPAASEPASEVKPAEPAPAAPEAAPATPQEEDIEELKKFKERYLSLKGKYDAEVPKLHSDLKAFKESIFQRLDQQLPATPATPATPAAAPVNERIEALKEQYGENLIDGLLELMRAETEPLKQKATETSTKMESFEEKQEREAQEAFMGALDKNVKGDWKALWSEKVAGEGSFAEFLDSPDPSGLYTFGELVEMYNKEWNSEKLAKVFNLYLETSGKAAPAPTAPAPATPTKAQEAARATKEALIAPSRTSTTSELTPAPEKTIWTRETIKAFEAADRQGKYSPEESKAMWDDLLSAMGENRIR